MYRQTDERFIYLLNAVRDGSITTTQLESLNQTIIHRLQMEEGKIILTTTNARASAINQQYLKQLDQEEFSYKAQATGQFYKELFPTDEVLKLKKGAQVIMIKNDSEKRWVNGSIGTIHDIAQKMIKVKINNKIYEVKKEKWDRIQYTYDDDQHEVLEEITGSFKQFPMRLAWAITIHKSQGQTFEKVIIDMSLGSFAPGQLYVALSRCISLEGIELIRPIKKSDIIVNHQLIGFQDRLI